MGPIAVRSIVLLFWALLGAAALEQAVLSGNENDLTFVHERLSQAGIIPDVLADFEPVLGLDISWDSDSASLGNTLNPQDLQSAPAAKLETAKEEDMADTALPYVLTLTDPDAPSHDDPKWSEFCHWIATGLPAPSGVLSASSLEDVIEYKPPGPPSKTGKHRYVFVVFVPANGTTEALHLSKPSDRQHWGYSEKGHGVRDWARSNGLVPVAANFIYAENKKQ